MLAAQMHNNSPIKYISTRGNIGVPALDFEAAVLAGLAPDGGLYVPEELPHFSPAQLASWVGLPYDELAFNIIQPLSGGAIADADLRKILAETYAGFSHPAIAPLKQLENNLWLLELFHGPTLAFKDFALQFLGRLMDFFLTRSGKKLVVLGATSGDTGSAAIAGCRGRASMDIVILFPHGRVSEVQRRQMSTITDKNVHCLAIEGNFDDCQNIVKTLFVDSELQASHPLAAVNSINWARILAQVVYYFYAALAVGAPARKVAFSVPTGNFGDVYAGHLARRMGLPIENLMVATNRNDILARCIASGEYNMQNVEPSYSPSMDIQISSNFERLLFELYGNNSAMVQTKMLELKAKNSFSLESAQHAALRAGFSAQAVDDNATLQCIGEIYQKTGELLDPHSAIAVYAAQKMNLPQAVPVIALATAHPAKFPDAVLKASGVTPTLPKHLQDLFSLEERITKMPADAGAVKAFVNGLPK